MGGCTSTSLKISSEKKFRRAIKLYEVTEVSSLTNLFNRNKCFESGDSPLTLAAQEGHEAVVEALIEHGADVNMLDKNGRSPLHFATQLNDVETVNILLDHRADPNKYDDYHNVTALHLACERGYAEVAEALLKHGAESNECARSLPPIVYAVAHKRAQCVEALLRHKANPNSEDARGNSLLHTAVNNSDAPVVKLLISFGANIMAKSRDSETLICISAMLGDFETMQVLIEAGCDVNGHRVEEPPAIIASVIQGNVECIEALLSSGADVNTCDKRTQTALQIACLSMVDTDRAPFYCRYFSNVYRQYCKFDPVEMSAENSCKCAMSLVQFGADITPVWHSFARVFPESTGITFEQMVLCEVLIQAYGFEQLSEETCRLFVAKLCELKEYGLVKLLYSAGVNPSKDDLAILATGQEEGDREMFLWVKRLLQSPRQLADLCRQRIRRSLSWNVLHLIERIPMSSECKDYVCIMDTEHYSMGE